ncbi:MAG: tetratricopeptide repeat protein [Sedimentisphaerales bacterium]
MLRRKTVFMFIILAVFSAQIPLARAETWRLEENQNWDIVADSNDTGFLSAAADVQKTVDKGKTKDARKEFAALKADFPDYADADMDLFVKAELLLSRNKFSKAARIYDKLLTKYPESPLSNPSIIREYQIGMTYLEGRKKVVLGLIPISGNEEGIGILEKMIDHAGYDKQISLDASIAIAKNYEKRKKFEEAYLKWYEIYSLADKDAITDRDALLGMARAKLDAYNKNPNSKKWSYDAAPLRTAKSYFEILKTSYPEYAAEIGVDETLSTITEELAYKQLRTGLYYQRMGNKQSANLYFDMVVSNWPESKSAEMAKNMLDKNTKS